MKLKPLSFMTLMLVPILLACMGCSTPIATFDETEYMGWPTQCLGNEWIKVHVAPELGGRIIQYEVGDKAFFWVNPDLAGKTPPESGLAPDGGWLNYGGEKLWPAPQGWDGPHQWPGPPDAVLDGQPHAFKLISDAEDHVMVELTSREAPRTGIRFSRSISVFPDSTQVAVRATMTNTGDKPRRWGIWTVSQLDAGFPGSLEPNRLMKAWCPINPNSRFPAGYNVMFGSKNNPSFKVDQKRSILEASYQYQVGKIGIDSEAVWTATVDGATGMAFVQRFTFEPDKPYPDNASVEFWHNGVGTIRAHNKDTTFPDDPRTNPYVFESELLSPFLELAPGESGTMAYTWQAANIGGDYPVLDCNETGVIATPFTAVRMPEPHTGYFNLKGRFGVFLSGKMRLYFVDSHGRMLKQLELKAQASPLTPVVLDLTLPVPAKATSAYLLIIRRSDDKPAMLAQTPLR